MLKYIWFHSLRKKKEKEKSVFFLNADKIILAPFTKLGLSITYIVQNMLWFILFVVLKDIPAAVLQKLKSCAVSLSLKGRFVGIITLK